MDPNDPDDARKLLGMDPPEQATSPIITTPVVLDDEALKSTSFPWLEDADKPTAGTIVNRPKKEVPLSSPTKARATTPTKPRGRPPGSKNKPKDGVKPQVVPDLDELRKKAEAISARSDELAVKVADTINENLMLLLTSLGTPASFLYLPGQEPKTAASNSKYTELGNSIALSPHQANIIGHFLAHLEQTDTGQKVGSMTGVGKGPLVVYGVLSRAAVIQYTQGLAKMYKTIEPMLAAHRDAMIKQQEQQQPNQANGGTNEG